MDAGKEAVTMWTVVLDILERCELGLNEELALGGARNRMQRHQCCQVIGAASAGTDLRSDIMGWTVVLTQGRCHVASFLDTWPALSKGEDAPHTGAPRAGASGRAVADPAPRHAAGQGARTI